MLPCFYKKFLGFECPGCGMQRSIIALFRGELYESFLLYPPLFFIILLLVLLIIHLIFKLKHGANILKWMFILNAIVIIISFIIKLTYTNNGCCAS